MVIAAGRAADLADPAEAAARGSGGLQRLSPPQRDLLCALSFVYLTCGQESKALPLVRLVASSIPDDISGLRLLAYALLANGRGDEALATVDRLEAIDGDGQSRLPLLLLRSHALRLSGRTDEARLCFQRFVAARNSPSIEEAT
jgi:hypothetical protein